MTSRHRVRSLTLDVALSSEADALALQPRLPGFGADHLIPVIERVLDRLDPPDRHVRLDRLDLDLGLLPLADFGAGLAPVLDRALEDALRRRLILPEEGDYSAAAADAPLDVLERYLSQGVLPYWAGSAGDFSLSAVIEDLSRGRPAELAALVIRLGASRAVLDRLAGYLSEQAFACLLGALDPANSGVIIAYLLDLREAHGRLPVVPLAERDLVRLLWVLTLGWEVRDPGSQFNRKSFVQSLLQGLATERSIDYAALVLTLHRGLGLAARRRQSAVSLPGVVRDIAVELGLGDPISGVGGTVSPLSPPASVAAQLQALERYLTQGGGAIDPPQLLAVLIAADPTALSALLRRVGRRPGVPAMLVAALGEVMLRRLLAALEPDSAAVILLYLSEIGQAHRAEPLIQAPAQRLRRLLWLLTLTFQVNDAGSRFNRKSYLRFLLTGLAEAEGVDYAALVATLQRGLRLTERRLNPTAVLPSVVGELAEEIARANRGIPDPSAAALEEAWTDAGTPGTGRTLWLERLALLMDQAPDQARRLLWRLGDRAGQADILADMLPPRLRSAVWGLLRPGERALLDALTIALEKLPAAMRPRHPPGQAVLQMVLRLGEGRALSAAVLAALLRRLFGDPPPLPVRRSLRRRLVQWRAAGTPPPSQLTALSLALAEGSSPLSEEADPAIEPPAPQPTDRSAVILAALRGERSFDPALLDEMAALLAAHDGGFLGALRDLVGQPALRRIWARRLPDRLTAALAEALAPNQSTDLAHTADILVGAWREVARDHAAPLPERGEQWIFLLDYLARTPAHRRSSAGLAAAFRSYLARKLGAMADKIAPLVRRAAVTRARRGGDVALAQGLERAAAAVPGAGGLAERVAAAERPAPASGKSRTSFGLNGEEGDLGEPIYIANAGLVLTGPFLPHLFNKMKWLETDPDGKPRLRPAKLSRAVQVLQWLVDERTDHAEPDLVLNKLLCGVDPAVAVTAGLRLTRTERQMADSLLAGMLANWPVIQSSSPAALRETFLRRDGKLQQDGASWRLTVQRKTVDVLVDQAPWSFSVILHPWMTAPIYVTW